ncbi:hypothetical protein [Nostoc mirabile]|nr:hypothetical protein [Nostoc mirabile]
MNPNLLQLQIEIFFDRLQHGEYDQESVFGYGIGESRFSSVG